MCWIREDGSLMDYEQYHDLRHKNAAKRRKKEIRDNITKGLKKIENRKAKEQS